MLTDLKIQMVGRTNRLTSSLQNPELLIAIGEQLRAVNRAFNNDIWLILTIDIVIGYSCV